ncbi:MAG: sensor histidine kinase [Candidatus Brocadiia bacterium]
MRTERETKELEAQVASLRRQLAAARAEQERLRSRLNNAERLAAVGTMSAKIAHQLRNPLTSIGLYVQLLEDELQGLRGRAEDEVFELLERVARELRTLVEITDNYLQYARLPEVQPARLDVNATVGELVEFLRHEMARKGVTMSTRLEEGVAAVEADRRLLRFALMNLLKNAVEAMGSGGRLRVRTAQRDGMVRIQVSDTGPGIEASERERIFEPFYTTKDAGSGLGLSLSRQIVEKHQGSLSCESMVGVGSTFTVCLPARVEDRRASDVHGRADGSDRG